MPLVAAAVCPQPPLLVPEIAAGAAAETADLRAACDAAVAALTRSGARSLVVVGAGDRTTEYRAPFRGSLAPWGGPPLDPWGDPAPASSGGPAPASSGGPALGERTAPGDGPPADPLPLSLLIGGWLLSRTAARPAALRMLTVDSTASADECRALGAGLGSADPWAMLVIGDGSACRGLKAPGYDDPRAEPYDKEVARALADADPDALLDLDPTLSAELKAAGRAPWQVLAGAARAAGSRWRGELTYEAAPYGVAYFVARWTGA
ncbi:MAG TPA: hypothetical protein VF657_07895 [Actinoplanes sp.]